MEVDGQSAEPVGWLNVDPTAGQVSGNAGCNDFRMAFEGSPGDMQPGPIGSTKKLCVDPAMAQERRVFEILGAATEMAVDTSGMLKITGTRGYLRADLEKSP